MNYPDLKPGVRALTLPHPLLAGSVLANQIVTITEGPHVGVAWSAQGTRSMILCNIALENGQTSCSPDQLPYAWLAEALLPLPPDDEAYKLFGKAPLAHRMPNAEV